MTATGTLASPAASSAAPSAASHVLLDHLRQRFHEGATTRPHGDDGAQEYSEPLTPAAVLVPIVLRPEGATMLLTQRTDHLRDHAGQVSFPGGRCEETDGSARVTALRESEEEVGLTRDRIEIIGELPRYRTGTGFLVTPVIGLVTPPLELKLDSFEVAKVFEPPLAFLLDRGNFRRQTLEYKGRTREFWATSWEGHFIWGATAGMLVMLHHFLFPETETS